MCNKLTGAHLMKKLIAVSAIAMMAATSAAFAADPIRPAPIVPVGPVVDSSSIWDGFYAGLNVGYGWGTGTVTDANGSLSDDIDGWLGGAQVGYNFSSGGAVFGIEADIQAANVMYRDDIAPGVTGEIGVQSFGTLRGRIGADMGGFMPYVTGGLAYGQLGYSIDAGGPTISDSDWAFGWAAGLGVEAMVMDNMSIKAEYLYTSLGTATVDVGGPLDLDADFHSARIGFNFHF